MHVGTVLLDLFVIVCMRFFELQNWFSLNGFRLFGVKENEVNGWLLPWKQIDEPAVLFLFTVNKLLISEIL